MTNKYLPNSIIPMAKQGASKVTISPQPLSQQELQNDNISEINVDVNKKNEDTTTIAPDNGSGAAVFVQQQQTVGRSHKDYGEFEIVHFHKPDPEQSYASLYEQQKPSFTICHSNKPSALKSKKSKPALLSYLKPTHSLTSHNLETAAGEKVTTLNDKTLNLFMELLPDNNTCPDQGNQVGRPGAMYEDDCHSNASRPFSRTSTLHVGDERQRGPVVGYFNKNAIEQVVQHIFKDFLEDTKYDVEFIRSHVTLIADLIKTRIRHLFHHRYRLICLVHVVEKRCSSIEIVSRCCWDTETDNFLEYIYHGNGFILVCTIFAVHLE